jgi:hypothetical protein
MTVLANSRNLLTQVVQITNPLNGQPLKSRPAFINLRPRVTQTAPDDQILVVTGSMTWGNVGAQFLGDARAYWTFADLSKVVDPFDPSTFSPGVQIRGPSVPRYLFSILAPSQTQT